MEKRDGGNMDKAIRLESHVHPPWRENWHSAVAALCCVEGNSLSTPSKHKVRIPYTLKYKGLLR